MKTGSYQRFSKRLTKWMDAEEMKELQAVAPRFNRRYTDVSFIVKSNRKKIKPMYAIFIAPEKLLRRKEDRDRALPFPMNITDILLFALPHKQEGVCLLNTALKYLK